MAKKQNRRGKTSAAGKKAAPKNSWALPVGIVGALVVLLVAGAVWVNVKGSGAATPAASVSPAAAANQDLVIPIGELSETAKFYPVDVDGTRMEVLAVKTQNGEIRTAFNTCQVCYSSGRGYYKQQGEVLVCQNCGNQFLTSQVEIEAGGCNPWPIFDEDKTVTEDSITVSYEFLKESKGIFANWKSSY
ncbi:MAG: Fe-S-containing protein [Oscillospiraceae bacterium]